MMKIQIHAHLMDTIQRLGQTKEHKTVEIKGKACSRYNNQIKDDFYIDIIYI